MAYGQKFEDSLQKQLKNELFAFEFIRDAFEEPAEDGDDIGYLMRAIGQVAKAQGVGNVSDHAGLARSAIYKIIKEDSNPSFKNIVKILQALNLKFNIERIEKEEQVADVLDVAAYLLEHARASIKSETTFWIQKMVYYSQVMSLVHYHTPLFKQDIEAWANGPVVQELYQAHKGVRYIKSWNTDNLGDSTNLSNKHQALIDLALEKYGNQSGQILSELTHSERPWNEARGDLEPHVRSNNIITHNMILDFYLNRPDYRELDELEV